MPPKKSAKSLKSLKSGLAKDEVFAMISRMSDRLHSGHTSHNG
jgi:hypothetical protein